MSIRRRLELSYLAILILSSLNLAVYFWGNQKRSATARGSIKLPSFASKFEGRARRFRTGRFTYSRKKPGSPGALKKRRRAHTLCRPAMQNSQ